MLAATTASAQRPAMLRTERAFPTGDRATSILMLERNAPADVRAGEEVSYEIRLTNLTRARMTDLLLTEAFPTGFTVKSVVPEPQRREGGNGVWQIAALEPSGATSIQVTGTAQAGTDFTGCATVAFSTNICSTTKIVEPKLALSKEMLPQALLCDEIPVRIRVANTGSGVARGVRVSDTLPNGLTTTDGRNALAFDAGDLAAGQSREFTASLRAAATGEFCNKASATELGGLSAEAQACVRVSQPKLALTKTGPDLQYLGRTATFALTVTNNGDAPARDTVVTDMIPPGMTFVSADNGGSGGGSSVTWRVGTLDPGQSRSMSVTVSAMQIGRFENKATARAYCAEAAAAAPIDVKGIPAILLEVIDIHDPIEVGAEETYQIEVTNQGSADDTNIVIVCTVPPQQQAISGGGATSGAVQGDTIRFAPLPSLGPKAKAVFTVKVRGTQVGDTRFKVSMTSDQIQSPVEETESTRIY